MKFFNKIYLLALVLVAFACDPYQEEFEQFEAENNGPTASLEITLEDEDYESLEDLVSVSDTAEAAGIANFANFSSDEQVRKYIPVILDNKYPWFQDNSSVLVEYNFYNPKRFNPEEYTVTEADYDALGGNIAQYGNFSSQSDIISFLQYKYPDANSSAAVELTYQYYSGSTNTVTDYCYYFGGQWYVDLQLSSEDYTTMGESFSNFDDVDRAIRKIGIFLGEESKFEQKEEGDLEIVIYTFTDVDDDGRYFEDRVLVFEYDGSSYVNVPSVEARSLQFSKIDGEWVPDNTITYTLTRADYNIIGDIEIANGNTARGNNIKDYGNFYQNFPGGDTHWTDEDIFAILSQFLLQEFPNVEPEQKFIINYVTYTGSNTDNQVSLILNSEGVYVVNE